MLKMKVLGLAAGFSLLLWPQLVSAQCIEDPRAVKLDNDHIVRMKSYLCGVPDGPQIRVEFLRFSEIPANLIVDRGSSVQLAKTIGSPKILENDVFQTYADILKQFGETNDVPKGQGEILTAFAIGKAAGLESNAGGQGADDTIAGRKMRRLPELWFFPAAEEVASLKKRIIPSELSYQYSFEASHCQNSEDNDSDNYVCAKFNDEPVELQVWRGITANDVADYAKKVAAYNALVASAEAEAGRRGSSAYTDEKVSAAVPAGLRMLKYLAGDNWPQNFYRIVGSHATVTCGEGDYIPAQDGWDFHFEARSASLEAVLIENVTNKPVTIGAISGYRSPDKNLRIADTDTSAVREAGTLLADVSQSLAAGQKLLVPTRMSFPAVISDDMKKYAQLFDGIQNEIGANGFTGNTGAYRPAELKDYVYGTELAINSILLDGKRIDLNGQPPVLIDLTVSAGAGSCPYLSSWDGTDGEWVEHGKILHKGQGKSHEYSETRSFEGFRGLFRLEEREPEIAYIRGAELAVVLRRGETLILRPDVPRPGNASLIAGGRDYHELMWGERIEMAFALPEGIAEEDVLETRLTVTGYYERYSNLLAAADFNRRNGLALEPAKKASSR